MELGLSLHPPASIPVRTQGKPEGGRLLHVTLTQTGPGLRGGTGWPKVDAQLSWKAPATQFQGWRCGTFLMRAASYPNDTALRTSAAYWSSARTGVRAMIHR